MDMNRLNLGSRVLLDASFWIALRDQREPQFAKAQAVARQLFKEKVQLVITPFILAEVHAYFSRSPHLTLQILNDFENNPVMCCESLTSADQREAIAILRKHRDKAYSFCDAVSFALMRRLGIRQAASFDDHFRQFGEFEIIS